MSIQRIGVGPRMSAAVVHGDTIYLAGQVADKAAGGERRRTDARDPRDHRRHSRPGRLGQDASAVGDDLSSDISTFAEMNSVWDAWVAKGHTPARATVEAKLAAPKFTVEIACIAAKP